MFKTFADSSFSLAKKCDFEKEKSDKEDTEEKTELKEKLFHHDVVSFNTNDAISTSQKQKYGCRDHSFISFDGNKVIYSPPDFA